MLHYIVLPASTGSNWSEKERIREMQDSESVRFGEEIHPEEGRDEMWGFWLSTWVKGGTTERGRAGWEYPA